MQAGSDGAGDYASQSHPGVKVPPDLTEQGVRVPPNVLSGRDTRTDVCASSSLFKMVGSVITPAIIIPVSCCCLLVTSKPITTPYQPTFESLLGPTPGQHIFLASGKLQLLDGCIHAVGEASQHKVLTPVTRALATNRLEG